MGVFDTIADALVGKPSPPPAASSSGKKGYDSRQFDVPPSVQAARRAMLDKETAKPVPPLGYGR